MNNEKIRTRLELTMQDGEGVLDLEVLGYTSTVFRHPDLQVSGVEVVISQTEGKPGYELSVKAHIADLPPGMVVHV